jgi:4-hydroxyphenylpyruvate dioxygenase
MLSTLLHPEAHTQKDFLPINGIDYIEFYVGNARQSAHYYRAAFGMTLVAWAGPETGLRDRASYVLEQGGIRFVLTTPLRPDGSIAEHIHRHGDGVRDIAISVDDVKLAWRETTRRGARSVHECQELQDQYGRVKRASVAAYGDTIHTFVNRGHYHGPFLPGYRFAKQDPIARPVGLRQIDYVAANVGWNEMRRWVDYYSDILGFSVDAQADDSETSTRYSALNSKVVATGNGCIRFPINEPAEGRDRSRIEEYLESYHGPGVQHIALATDGILETVEKMRQQGVEFELIPPSYYRELSARVGLIDEPVEELERLGILVDRDSEGYLLQALTKPMADRPTLFFEVLQRKGSRGFGKGNFEALAHAVETEIEILRRRPSSQ